MTIPEGNVPVFRQEHDWNMCGGPALHDGKAWFQYWLHEGDEWTLVEEREIVLPESIPFEKRSAGWAGE